MNPTPVVLYGEHVRLEPLDTRHADQLLEEAQNDDIWRFMPVPRPTAADQIRELIDRAWKAAADGAEVPFCIVADGSDRAVGSTRFLDIRRSDRGLEIGWTWLGTAAQRTMINTETKFLLMRHAFEDLGALRVQFRTDGRNEVSQRALERLGAVREGTLRHHQLTWDGVYRDTVCYSVLAGEWPHVKAHLEQLLGR